MFQLTIQNIIQFISLTVYFILVIFLLYAREIRLKRLFSVLLIAAVGISSASLLMNLQMGYEQMVFWKMLLPLFITWSIVAYAHFVTAFTGRDTRIVIKLGYTWLAVCFVGAAFGFLVYGLNLFMGGNISIYYGLVMGPLVFLNDLFMVVILFFMIGVLKNTSKPDERNKTAYLLAGLVFMVIANIFKYVVPDYYYLLYSVGCTGNVILVTYILLRHRLLDIQVLMRKSIVYSGVTVTVTLGYLALLLGLSNLLRLLPAHLGIPAMILMVILFACLFNWVKAALDKAADRLFFGRRYTHRQMLLNFAGKMSNFINIKEISNALISSLVKTVRAKQVALLLPENGHYSSKYIARLDEGEQVIPMKLQITSPLTRCLETTGIPLLVDNFKNTPGYSGLIPEDKNAIDMFQTEVLCPIISRRKLVGILVLSEKEANHHYSRDDIDLLAMLTRESAAAIDNAQIYSLAKQKADTDELTGLYNHSYLQGALNQEIERCSASGDDFSLLCIDLDFFKTYNDIYGHVLGDEILKEVGQIIKNSIRDTDIGARYGGDEFAVILKDTVGDEAKSVAERIRRELEACMNQKGILLTCSIGIACWRTDGVMRGEIIQSADKALYSAKEAGRNLVCMASNTNTIEAVGPVPMLDQESSAAIESIVFALASTVDARDHYTYNHSRAVSNYATELAKAVGYRSDGIRRIRAAALLHDIGKLHLPDSVLTKKTPLTDKEWEMIKNHPQLGLGILKYVVGLRDCIDAVLYHHERYDGGGYPRGLEGKDIPLDARIMAIADSYDAMTSERSYKVGRLTEDEAVRELEKCAGSQFDPELVEVFIKLRKKPGVNSSCRAGS